MIIITSKVIIIFHKFKYDYYKIFNEDLILLLENCFGSCKTYYYNF